MVMDKQWVITCDGEQSCPTPMHFLSAKLKHLEVIRILKAIGYTPIGKIKDKSNILCNSCFRALND
jgi:hypothetical protein